MAVQVFRFQGKYILDFCPRTKNRTRLNITVFNTNSAPTFISTQIREAVQMEKFEIIATTQTKTQNNSTFVRVVSLLFKKKTNQDLLQRQL